MRVAGKLEAGRCSYRARSDYAGRRREASSIQRKRLGCHRLVLHEEKAERRYRQGELARRKIPGETRHAASLLMADKAQLSGTHGREVWVNRSLTMSTGRQVAKARACKARIAGSTPARCSNFPYLSASAKVWRKRVRVEHTLDTAKVPSAGFEDREDHRIPFASSSVQHNRNGQSAVLRSQSRLYSPAASNPALRRIRRTFFGDTDNFCATREILRPSRIQTFGITISANSSVTC